MDLPTDYEVCWTQNLSNYDNERSTLRFLLTNYLWPFHNLKLSSGDTISLSFSVSWGGDADRRVMLIGSSNKRTHSVLCRVYASELKFSENRFNLMFFFGKVMKFVIANRILTNLEWSFPWIWDTQSYTVWVAQIAALWKRQGTALRISGRVVEEHSPWYVMLHYSLPPVVILPQPQWRCTSSQQ